jgi:hypothetical protein
MDNSNRDDLQNSLNQMADHTDAFLSQAQIRPDDSGEPLSADDWNSFAQFLAMDIDVPISLPLERFGLVPLVIFDRLAQTEGKPYLAELRENAQIPIHTELLKLQAQAAATESRLIFILHSDGGAQIVLLGEDGHTGVIA